jgi:transposase
VEAVRGGASQREVADRLGVGRGTVQRALVRVGDGDDLDAVDWTDRSTAPHRTRRTDPSVEARIVRVREELRDGILGDHGPAAIREAMLAAGDGRVPAERTIARIVTRLGLNERPRRIRRPAPPRGWYLPAVAAGKAELDAFDAIIDLPVFAHGDMDVLTGISLHGGDPDAWPGRSVTAVGTCAALEERWRRIGRPAYAQFDNDTRFLGSHGYPDILGRVPLLALRLGVTPVFAPVREMGFQADIEAFNGRWQRRVYARAFGFPPEELASLSGRYLTAVRARRILRIEAAPPRRPWPGTREPRAGRGRVVFLRRTTIGGEVEILGRLYLVDRSRVHRLVRAELDLDDLVIRCFALHRREPGFQPLLAELPYVLPTNRTWVARMY